MVNHLENGINLFGYLLIDREDDICLNYTNENNWKKEKIAELIADNMFKYADRTRENENEDEYYEVRNAIYENVSINIHVSNEKMSLEEAKNKQILFSIGELNIYESWYGYSEWTIEGYSVDEFKLIGNGGEHDLTEILKGYEGKYIHIICEIVK